MRKNDQAEMTDVTYVGKSVLFYRRRRRRRKDCTGIVM